MPALPIRRRAVLTAPVRYCLLVEHPSAHGRPARWARGLLYCGLAAGPLFVTTFLAKGATRDGYRPGAPSGQLAGARATRPGPGRELRRDRDADPRRAAGLGHAADPALSSRAGRALIGAAGVGLIGAAVFATDPVSGYPPGTPGALTQPTRTGMMHNFAAVPVFLGLPAAAVTCSRQSIRVGHRGFGLYCAATATTMLATTALAGAGFNQSPRLVNLAGLFQRASIVTGFGWLTALSAQALAPTCCSSPPTVNLNRPLQRSAAHGERHDRMSATSRFAVLVPAAQAPQATEVLTPEPALRFFHTDETRVCRLLVVRVLGVVPAAVDVHDASESVFVRRPSGETARPAGLGRVPLSHAASMRANPAQALVAA